MDRMIYIAMSGARQVMHKQASNNNNLANVNTSGFKAQFDNFTSVPVYGPGHPARVYGINEQPGADFSQGTVTQTGNPLDVAIDGPGFIAIQDVDGREAYTRAGNMQVNSSGVLQTASGYPVMGNGGPIVLSPFEKVMIGSDGTITIKPLGQTTGELAVIDRIKLVNPDVGTLKRNDRGFFTLEEGNEPADGSVRLATESLEASNVNSVEALVTMIELSRQFETQVKLMKAAEDNDAAAGRLLQAS